MTGRNRRDIPKALARAEDRFRAWRRTRASGSRIPEQLWKLSVKLAAAHGLNRTASVLGLDYYGLKKRVDEAGAPAFVELTPPPASSSGECVIELEDGAGATMRMHLKGYEAPDLVALGRSFWNGE